MNPQAIVRDHYSEKARLYDAPVHRAFYTAVARRLIEGTHLKAAPLNILEIGSGAGASTRVLRASFPHAEITVLEPAQGMCDRFKKDGFLAHCRIFSGELADMLISGEKFDLVFLSMSFHWLGIGSDVLMELVARQGCLAMAVPHKHVFTAGEHKPRGNRWVAEVWKELKARSRKTACAEKGIGAVPAIYVEDDWRGISVKTWSDRALYGKRPSNGSKPSRSINKIGRESILERIPAPEFASTLLVRGVLLSMFGSDQTLAYKILKKKINVLAESHVDYVWPISYAIMRHPEL